MWPPGDSLRLFGFVEEQHLERHAPHLPLGVQRLADDEAAVTGGIEGQDRGEIHVHVLAADVDARSGALESHERGDVRLAEARAFEAGGVEGLPLFFRKLEADAVVQLHERVPLSDVPLHAGAKPLEHHGRRALRFRGDPLELI